MEKDGEYMRKLAIIVDCIPVEMYWAYEAVRQSGIWNMFCLNPVFARYTNDSQSGNEVVKTMDEIYIRFCCYTNADISQPGYNHMTKDHARLIQELYDVLQEVYDEMPKDVVNITKKVTTSISF